MSNKYKKLKKQYRNSYIKECFFIGYLMDNEIYPNMRNNSFKNFSTKQESSFFLLHENENKEYNIKLRRRRSDKNLPNSWDDYPSYTYKLGKSWKHNSKRVKQYYKNKT